MASTNRGVPVKDDKHKVGFWVGPCVVDTESFQQGPWERDRVVFERELFFACIHWGITCLRVRASHDGP
jgi:hypothetical protein